MAYYILLLSQMVGEWYFIWLLPFTLISGQAAIRKASLLVACCLMPLAIFTCNGVLIPGLLTQVLTLLIYAPLLILTLGAVIPHFRKLAPADLESRV